MAHGPLKWEFEIGRAIPLDTAGSQFAVKARNPIWGGPMPLQGTVAINGVFGGATVTLQGFFMGQWLNTDLSFTAAGINLITVSPGPASNSFTMAAFHASSYRLNVVGGDGTTAITAVLISEYGDQLELLEPIV